MKDFHYGCEEFFVPSQEEEPYDQQKHGCLTDNGVKPGDKIKINDNVYKVYKSDKSFFYKKYIIHKGLRIPIERFRLDKIKIIKT